MEKRHGSNYAVWTIIWILILIFSLRWIGNLSNKQTAAIEGYRLEVEELNDKADTLQKAMDDINCQLKGMDE